MATGHTGIRFRTIFAISAILMFAAPAVADPYRLAPGDIVQLSVVGFPELKQTTPVNVDGNIMLPLVGTVNAAGQTVNELSTAVRGRFANKVMQQRGADGRAVTFVIAPDEVTIDISEYRPVYIRGDVAKPGEVKFRPGMTVRQAVAVSGGYDVVRLRGENTMLETARLRGDVNGAWTDIARYEAVRWRLRAEIGEAKGQPDPEIFAKSTLTPELVERVFKTEADQLATRKAERDREIAYLKNVIDQSDRRLDLLSEQQKNEQEASKADTEDFERVSKLFEKGAVAITRFSDSRRSMLLSATRILQTSAAIAQVEREREELKKMLASVDDKRRIQVLTDLQEVEGKLLQARARLKSTQEQLLYSGRMRNRINGSKQQVALAIVRQTSEGRQNIVATEDTELVPGDSVEATLDMSQILADLPD